jgi:hypothetical protein
MAEQSLYNLECARTEMRVLTAHFTGGGTGALVPLSPEDSNGDILSTTRTGVGTHTVVFRRFFPRLKVAPIFSFTGTLPLTGRCSAIDYTANPPTATFVFSVGAFETDLPTTDTVDVTWIVRNSARND